MTVSRSSSAAAAARMPADKLPPPICLNRAAVDALSVTLYGLASTSVAFRPAPGRAPPRVDKGFLSAGAFMIESMDHNQSRDNMIDCPCNQTSTSCGVRLPTLRLPGAPSFHAHCLCRSPSVSRENMA